MTPKYYTTVGSVLSRGKLEKVAQNSYPEFVQNFIKKVLTKQDSDVIIIIESKKSNEREVTIMFQVLVSGSIVNTVDTLEEAKVLLEQVKNSPLAWVHPSDTIRIKKVEK